MGTGNIYAACGLVLAAILTGCSTNSPGAPTAEPTPLPADQIVFAVSSGPGYSPTIMFSLQSPAIAIYGDGRILLRNPPVNYDLPGSYSVSRVEPAEVARFVAATEAGGLISPSTDAGDPQVTDQGNTTFTLHADTAPASLSVYAYGSRFTEGLSADEKAVRARLAELIDTARGLADGRPAEDLVPDEVTVFELEAAEDPAATILWPGPDPEEFLTGRSPVYGVDRCGVLRGPAAATVHSASLNNRGAAWLVDGANRVLVVNPLPFGGVSCESG